MKLKNWKMSEEKWQAIKEELDKPGKVDWDKLSNMDDGTGNCGHCQEYTCQECTLQCRGLGYFDYVDMEDGDTPSDKRKARAIANRIYEAILKDKPKEA